MDQRELARTGSDGKPQAFMIVLVMHLDDPTNLVAESKVFKSIVIACAGIFASLQVATQWAS